MSFSNPYDDKMPLSKNELLELLKTGRMLNHELIHSAQQRELLYIPFFIWYVIEWFILYLKYKDWTKAYFHIRFEQEAYKNQSNLEYLKYRKHYKYK